MDSTRMSTFISKNREFSLKGASEGVKLLYFSFIVIPQAKILSLPNGKMTQQFDYAIRLNQVKTKLLITPNIPDLYKCQDLDNKES